MSTRVRGRPTMRPKMPVGATQLRVTKWGLYCSVLSTPFDDELLYFVNHLLFLRHLSKCLNKPAFRIHQIHKDRMIHQIVPFGISIWRSRKVDTVRLAHRFGFLIVAHKPNKRRVEVSQIGTDSRRRISRRIDRYKYWLKGNIMA